MSASRIAVALFDLDDTLLAHREAVDRAITRIRQELPGAESLDDSAEAVRWHELEETHYPRYLSGELSFVAQRRERARDFLAAYGVVLDEAATDAWWEHYFEAYRDGWEPHPDAAPVIDELIARGIRIGVITNGEADFQLRKLESLGLTDRVEHFVASGALGITKPDARIFLEACALFDAPPAAAMYVGDRLATDAIGAVRAGLSGVWLDRRRTATAADRAEASAAGVTIIHGLHELLPLLE